MSASIPRFLLPRGTATWRPSLSSTTRSIRAASTKAPKPKAPKPKAPASKIPVLEKPTRFNPPSHGKSIPNRTVRYPGPALSAEELAAQKTKKYPTMMPPQGTFMYWFLNNRSIHIYITLGVLSSLAGFTFLVTLRRDSKFGDLLPEPKDAIWHPFKTAKAVFEVLRLDGEAKSAETKDRRQRSMDDVAKRGEYRKAHGLETEGFGGWTAKEAPPAAVQEAMAEGEQAVEQPREKRQVKKWLGIW
ncbi:hypothetical protein V495_06444 [Pseudogymnoascus sp. VKM F-4514 (FW-929)]|nr:hypothetical protein V495_06444 [Pseudogymnoascus sp. VKM F-4514 (FW-929)]KFY63427.1 hypothetical protein V497_02001 [Pseudogymnoascus sp. VKM F-4516 (FW-969)]